MLPEHLSRYPHEFSGGQRQRIANRIAVIYRGDIVELAEADELFNNPMHPYTKSLLSAVPLPDPKQEKMKVHYKYDPEAEHPDYLLDFPK
ncbi:hypothetical protein FQA39_LY13008 [Lamprigera yunnana]|nr:hypothetical protein FQA39_LY13008 [Lamprigera yunnana]